MALFPQRSVQEEDALAVILWEYLKLDHPLKKADLILVLGSNDLRAAEYAAGLFNDGYAPRIMFSGKRGRLTEQLFEDGMWTKSEAETFAEVALQKGVPASAVITEPDSTNTGENIMFSHKIIEHLGIPFHSIILVQKPYMGRRAYATFKKIWPEPEIMVTSPPIPFQQYPTAIISREYLINLMVGDLQRIKIYPDMGFQIPQNIPEKVWDAYEKLVSRGFTNHLVREN